MVIVGGTGSGRSVLTKIRHFLCCYNSSHFAASAPRTKNIFKIQKSRRGEKEAGDKGTEPSDKVETHR